METHPASSPPALTPGCPVQRTAAPRGAAASRSREGRSTRGRPQPGPLDGRPPPALCLCSSACPAAPSVPEPDKTASSWSA